MYFYIGATCSNFEVIFNTFLAQNLAEFDSCRLFYANYDSIMYSYDFVFLKNIILSDRTKSQNKYIPI